MSKRQAEDALHLISCINLQLLQDFSELENNLSCTVLKFFGKDGEEPSAALLQVEAAYVITPLVPCMCTLTAKQPLAAEVHRLHSNARGLLIAFLPPNTEIATQTENPNLPLAHGDMTVLSERRKRRCKLI